MKTSHIFIIAIGAGGAAATGVIAIKESRIAAAERAHDQAIEKDLAREKEFVGRDGKAEALTDIARGTPKLLGYGKEPINRPEWVFLLKQRFSVGFDPLAGCIVNEPLVTFARAYNTQVKRYITEKFGATALEQIDDEASRMFKAQEKANQSVEPTTGSVTPRTPQSSPK